MINKTRKKQIFLIIGLFFMISFISQTDLYAKSKPTIYVMGDSIAHSYVGNKQQNGWGQRLYQYFQYPSKMKMSHVKGASDYVDVVRYNTPKISIENWAKAGASVKIFDKYGMFESIQKKLKKGDYVFIQLGHNEVYTQWWTGSTVSEYKTYLIDQDVPFVLYEKYSRRDVSFLMDCGKDLSSTMYGMKKINDDVFIFVTYHKEKTEDDGKEYIDGKPDYADVFEDNQIFCWDTQIGRGIDSSYTQDVMKAYRKHLMVKKSDTETTFYYMGQFDIVEVKPAKKIR